MSPGLSLRGPNDFKTIHFHKRGGGLLPLSSRSVTQGSGPRAFVNRSAPASQCPAQGSPLQANAPRSPPLRPLGMPGLHLNGFCVPGRRRAHRSSEISPGCWRPGSAPPGRGDPCHPTARGLRLPAAGPWESTPLRPPMRPPSRGRHSWRDGAGGLLAPKVFYEP